jgi:MFS family permease
VFIV